jgi:anti-sigma-K factor RskA
MVGLVEPRPEVWEKIRTSAGLSEPQAPLVLPDAPPLPVAPASETAATAADASNVVALSSRARRWRGVAAFTSAIAAALIAMLAVQAYDPELLPAGLRPTPKTEVAAAKPPAAPAPASAQYVAVLQKDGGSPAFILTVDGATRNFTVRKVNAAADAGKTFELWLISDKLQRPRSLGVIGASDFTARPVLAGYDADTIKGATYAVTLEQQGGSPDGKPTSAPVFAGKLIETVPPSAPAPSR